jgi:hypothetical protein
MESFGVCFPLDLVGKTLEKHYIAHGKQVHDDALCKGQAFSSQQG